ncbi:MAG: hypothetical protein ACP5ME_14340, partial [Anaerolineae bacterium]
MSSNTTWRWTSLLVVLAMMLSMAAATVSASPAPARPEAPSAAPAQQPPPPKTPPSKPSPQGEGKSDEALTKLAPELRPIAKARSPELVLETVLMQAGTKVEPYFQRVVVRKPIGGLQWA